MDKFEGKELQEVSHGLGPLEVKKIMFQLLMALDYLHSRGVIHRDVKPENILVGMESRIKLVDFNVSRKIESLHQKLMSQTGTLEFRSPEIIANSPYDYKVDIWSAGLVLYILAFKDFPFDTENIPKLALEITNFDIGKVLEEKG